MMTIVDASMQEALEEAETANTLAEFEAKSTKRKEFYKMVAVMYNCYTDKSADVLSPWVQQRWEISLDPDKSPPWILLKITACCTRL